MSYRLKTSGPCRNLNHGRSNVTINYCPECGSRFAVLKVMVCGGKRHADYRKQRFIYCVDCGGSLSARQ